MAPRRASDRIASKAQSREEEEIQEESERQRERERAAEERKKEEEEKQREKQQQAEKRQQGRGTIVFNWFWQVWNVPHQGFVNDWIVFAYLDYLQKILKNGKTTQDLEKVGKVKKKVLWLVNILDNN